MLRSAGLAAAVAEDYAGAFAEWLPLAEGGLAGAQSNIGDLYARGLGVEANPAEAFRWHSRAADQGIVKSQFFIAVAYASGSGVEKDVVRGEMWALVAQRFGEAGAADLLNVLAQGTTQEERDEAKRLADAWTPHPNQPPPPAARCWILPNWLCFGAAP